MLIIRRKMKINKIWVKTVLEKKSLVSIIIENCKY
jgi:hypothetical protein